VTVSDNYPTESVFAFRKPSVGRLVGNNLFRFHPYPEGKDLHPACLILYCLYNWGCYNGAQMGSVAALMEPANPWIQRPSSPRSAPIDGVLTRQCPCLGLSIHGESVGAWRIRRLQTETGVHMNLPRFGPPQGKDLHPACLILYCLYSCSCYNDAQMRSGYGKKRGIC
jgi:hypothetical protein